MTIHCRPAVEVWRSVPMVGNATVSTLKLTLTGMRVRVIATIVHHLRLRSIISSTNESPRSSSPNTYFRPVRAIVLLLVRKQPLPTNNGSLEPYSGLAVKLNQADHGCINACPRALLSEYSAPPMGMGQ